MQGLDLNIVNAINISDVCFDKCHYIGLQLKDAYDFTVDNCKFKDIELAGLAYGITAVYCTSNGTVSNCFGTNLRHMFATGGGAVDFGKPRNMTVSNNTMLNLTDAGLDCHPGAEKIVFDGNVIDSHDGDGITMQGTDCIVSNNVIKNSARQGILIQMFCTKEQNCIVIGNKINSNNKGISLAYSDAYLNFGKVLISNNVIDSDKECLNIDGQVTILKNVSIVANNMKSRTYQGMRILGLKDSLISNNIVAGVGSVDANLYLTGIDGVIISGNFLTGATYAIYSPVSMSSCIISNNKIREASLTGIDLRGTVSNVSIAGNSIDSMTSSFGIYCYLTTGDGRDINIINNILVVSGNNPINIRALAGHIVTDLIITGNNIQTDATVALYIQGADAGSIKNTIIADNIIKGDVAATYGIRLTNCDVIHSGKNIFETVLAEKLMSGVTNATKNTTEIWS